MKKLFYLASVLVLGFANAQNVQNAQNAQYTGKVGINTEKPQNTLHVHSDIDPLRLDGLQNTTMTGNSFLVAGTDGVVKKLDASSLKLLVEVRGGANWTASGLADRAPADKIVTNNPTPETAKSILALSDVKTNEGNAYDTTTGLFTAPEDGLYEFLAVTTWDINMACTIPTSSTAYTGPAKGCVGKEHPIAFNGQVAKVRAYLDYKSVAYPSANIRISYVDVPFFRGARTQDQGLMTYFLPNSATLWMKKGDTISLMYHYFGGFDVLTKADPFVPQTQPDGTAVDGAQDISRVYIRGSATYLKVYRAL